MKFYEMDDAANERGAELSRITASWTIKKGKANKAAEQNLLPAPEVPERIRQALTVEGLSPHARLVLVIIRAFNLHPNVRLLAKMSGLPRVTVHVALTQLYKAGLIDPPE